MAIKIKNNPPAAKAGGPHADAAADMAGAADTITETITETNTKDGPDTLVNEDVNQVVNMVQVPASHDLIAVGMGFKMPVAEYTMIEFYVQRTTPCATDAADDTYTATKDWVEGRLNELVEEQQEAQSEAA